jgi:transcriptional regulator with XRE-family HTH domain
MSNPAGTNSDGAAGQDRLDAFHGQFDWRASLREHRTARRLSQGDVAKLANLSAASVRAYENGSRHPTVEALGAMITAIGITPEDAAPIRAGAGYTVDLRWLISGRYAPSEIEDLATRAERYTWPVWVTNIAGQILVANQAFRRCLGKELAEVFDSDPSRRSFIASASDPLFADRVTNWEEAVSFMIGVAKGETRTEHNLERPAGYTAEAIGRFLQGDPSYVRRLMMLWQDTPPYTQTMRGEYPWHWRAVDGREMRFTCLIHVADIWNELLWGDYIPDDAETWQILSEQPAVH